MDHDPLDYAVGYGKPPVENRFQKGQSGNPGGRARRSKTLVALLGEALSRRSGYPNADGSWMTQAEVILAGLVAQAAGSDLKAKKLLFDIVVKLQGAPVWARDVPKIQLDDGEAAAGAEICPAMEDEASASSNDRSGLTLCARDPGEDGRDQACGLVQPPCRPCGFALRPAPLPPTPAHEVHVHGTQQDRPDWRRPDRRHLGAPRRA